MTKPSVLLPNYPIVQSEFENIQFPHVCIKSSYPYTHGLVFNVIVFYTTAFKGCRGIIFTHVVWMGRQAAGKSLSRLNLRNRKMYEVDTW